MNIKTPLKYSDVFPGPAPSIDDLLKQINKEKLIQASIHLSRNKKLENLNIFKFIEVFFPSKDKEFVISLTQNLSKIKNEILVLYTVISKSTCLLLLEKVVSIEYKTESITNFEIIVFKALLLINEDIIIDNEKTSSLLANKDRVSHAKFFFTSIIPTFGLESNTLQVKFFIEVYKAIQLLRFLKLESKLESTLTNLLETYNCQDSKEYLRLMLASVLPVVIKNDKKLHYLEFNNLVPDEEKQFKFIENISLSKLYKAEAYDFIALRSKPLLRIDDSKFLVLSDVFLCELIHTSLYFKLNEIYNKMNFSKVYNMNFRGFYCYEYSEKFLFYEVINHIFDKKNYIKISGEQFESQNIDGLIDFYIRNGNKILLFESKDSLFPAKLKGSYDYEAIEKVLKRNYHSDEGSKNNDKKAVLQLLESIQLILQNHIRSLDKKVPANSKFYPVLISHNSHTDIHGFNIIVNDWYQSELERLQIDTKIQIKSLPLTIINIDTLIYFQEHFMEKKFDLFMLIEQYHKVVKSNQYRSIKNNNMNNWEKQSISFGEFIFDHMNERSKMKPPKIISEMIQEFRST